MTGKWLLCDRPEMTPELKARFQELVDRNDDICAQHA
jgi:hypothetical protein